MLTSNSLVFTQISLPSFENLDDCDQSLSHRKQQTTFAACMKYFQTPVSERSSADLFTVVNTLRNFKFLENDELSVHDANTAYFELAKSIEYHRYSAGQVVFHKGDYDDRIYLVLQGNGVLYTEIAEDLFKPVTIAQVEEAIPNTEENLSKQRLSIVDDKQPNLFKPAMKRLDVRNHTTKGLGTGFELNPTLKDVPTLHELKKISHELQKIKTLPKDDSPVFKSSLILDNRAPVIDPEVKKKVSLYNLLVQIDKASPERYVRNGKFTFRPKRNLEAGDNFGEKASRGNKAQLATVVAVNDFHILSFRMETYIKVFNSQLGNWDHNNRFLEIFFRDISYPKLTKLLDLFEEGEYMQRQKIFEEKDEIDAMYLIKEGEVQLMKILDASKYAAKDETIPIDKIRKKCCIATVGQREALGDDDVFFGKKRNYTAVVTSAKAVLWKLNAAVYNGLSDVYKELFNSFKRAAKAKMNHRKKQVKAITKQAIQIAQAEAAAKKARTRPVIKRLQDPNESLIIPIDDGRLLSPTSKDEIESLIKFKKEPESPKRPRNVREGSGKVIRTYKASEDVRPYSTTAFGESIPRTPGSALIARFDRQGTFHDLADSGNKTTVGSPLHDPQRNRTSHNLRLLISDPDKRSPEPQWESPTTQKRSASRGALISVPNGLIPSALYKEALSHVKRKKVSENRLREKIDETNARMKDHKLYFEDLKKSVNILKVVANRSPIQEGYISTGVSPMGRTPIARASETTWDSLVEKSSANIKAILPGSLAREKTNSRTDLNFESRYKLMDNRLTMKNNLVREPLVREALAHSGSTSKLVTRITNLRQRTGDRNEMRESSNIVKSYIDTRALDMSKLNTMASPAKGESFEAKSRKRVGFKPGRILSLKDKD